MNEVLARKLNFSTEANSSSLGHSPLFSYWGSIEPRDKHFGSMGSFWETDFSGRNCLLVLDPVTSFMEIESRLDLLIESKRPTRIVVVCPSPLIDARPNHGYITVALIPTGNEYP